MSMYWMPKENLIRCTFQTQTGQNIEFAAKYIFENDEITLLVQQNLGNMI